MTDRCSRPCGRRRAAAPTSSTSGTARLRGASRMVETRRTGAASSSAAGVVASASGAHASRSRPFGTTATGVSNTASTRAAAAELTADRATGASDQRVRRTAPRIAGTVPSSMQCQVIAVGSPASIASRAPSNANGDSTPAWTCTTSGRRSSKDDRSRRGPAVGLIGRSNGRRAPSRCTHAVLQVDHAAALPRRPERGREDVHVVPLLRLPGREVADLRLDAARARRVAVGDVDDPHGCPGQARASMAATASRCTRRSSTNDMTGTTPASASVTSRPSRHRIVDQRSKQVTR